MYSTSLLCLFDAVACIHTIQLTYVPCPPSSVGLSMLSWSVELEALEDADTDDPAGADGCGPPARELRLVSLADLRALEPEVEDDSWIHVHRNIM